MGSSLKIIDNSGGVFSECIKVLGGLRVGYAGHTLITSLKKINPVKKLKKGEIRRTILSGTKKSKRRLNGFIVEFGINGGVIVDKKNLPICTRILGPVMLELRVNRLMKILSLATVAI